MKIGYFKIDITPEFPVELSGYGFYLKRKSKGVHDPIFSKSIYLRDNFSNEILIISCDLIGINREVIVRIKEKISKKTGIPSENIAISSTHTHSGPASLYLEGLGEINKKYLKILEEKIVTSGVKAKENSLEGKIGFAKTKVDISYNRENEKGPCDKGLRIIYLKNKNNSIVVYNYSCHCIALGKDNCLISADWPYYSNKKLEGYGSEGVFLQGFCGDINIKEGWQKDFYKAEYYGGILGEEIIKKLKGIGLKDMEIKIKSKIINLPMKIPDKEDIEEFYKEWKEKDSHWPNWHKFIDRWRKINLLKIGKNCRDFLPTEIKVIGFGKESCFFIVGGEIFNGFALEIKKISPFKYNFFISYSNDYVGYIPTKNDFFKGRFYASKVAPMFTNFFPFKENVGDILIEGFKELIGSLKKGSFTKK